MLDETQTGCPHPAVRRRQNLEGRRGPGETAGVAFLSKAEESKLGRIVVKSVILLSMHNQTDAARMLRDTAQFYKVDVDSISATVKQEFAAKDKGEGQQESHTEIGAEAREESGGVTSPLTRNSRGASKTGSAFSCPLPVYPPSCDAPDERRGDILAHPTSSPARVWPLPWNRFSAACLKKRRRQPKAPGMPLSAASPCRWVMSIALVIYGQALSLSSGRNAYRALRCYHFSTTENH